MNAWSDAQSITTLEQLLVAELPKWQSCCKCFSCTPLCSCSSSYAFLLDAKDGRPTLKDAITESTKTKQPVDAASDAGQRTFLESTQTGQKLQCLNVQFKDPPSRTSPSVLLC